MRKLAFAVIALMLVVLSAGAAQVASPHFKCNGTKLGVTIPGSLEVDAGDFCGLSGTVITGDLIVRGSLFLCGVHIGGNLIGDRALTVQLASGPTCYSTIDGNVDLDHTRGSSTSGSIKLCNATIGGNATVGHSSGFAQIGGPEECDPLDVGGNLNVDDNEGGAEIGDNRIQGDVTVQNNKGAVDISGNIIGGDLHCDNNDPAPTGSDDAVAGNATGQCSGFEKANTRFLFFTAERKGNATAGVSITSATTPVDCDVPFAGEDKHSCTVDENQGAAATITVTLGTNSTIDKWTGACKGTAATATSCTVTMDKDKSADVHVK